MRAVAAGEREAFQRLVCLHQRPLFGFAQRMLQDPARAEDVVQETLLRLWSRAGSFKPERARLTTWLHNIAHNLCVDSLRRESRFAPEETGDGGEPEHGGPSESEERRRADALLRRALGDLPERQRSALLLCHYQGMSNREAAQVLEVSVEALESLLARARRTLKKELKADDAD
ncbi:MAG: sigma-70 family RNA polymerase sigma factor [Pseudomonadota bacterium]